MSWVEGFLATPPLVWLKCYEAAPFAKRIVATGKLGALGHDAPKSPGGVQLLNQEDLGLIRAVRNAQ